MQNPSLPMETLLQDIRFGFRQLVRKPGFAALAIISMALGIGANTSIFSLIDTAVLRPLAVKDPSQLVEVYGTANKGADWAFAGRYQGEVNFLARLERPIVEIGKGENAAWLAAHPGGFVIERVDSGAPAAGKVVFRQRVEKGDLVVYAAGS